MSALFRNIPALLLLLTLQVACSEKPSLAPIPADLVDAAELPGFANVRQWDEPPASASPALPAAMSTRSESEARAPLNVLAISGGASNGAFAAGILTGWSQAGRRPPFHVVTGVSIGALIAPFAFLGPQYDDVLQWLSTALSSADILAPRPRPLALFYDSLASAKPLQALIRTRFDEQLMHMIAAEHRTGRRLFVGTTHVYAGRLAIWDIGAIAASGRADALALIHRVLLAAASVPILLPPVFFDVEAKGGRYNEMHVDGGIMRQLFVAPPGFDWSAAARTLGTDAHPSFYVIRNGRVRSEYMVMQPAIVDLGQHAMYQLTQSLGIGDLNTIYVRAEREQASYRAAWIDDSFTSPWAGWYDPQYTGALFEHGRDQALGGRAWHAYPPGAN